MTGTARIRRADDAATAEAAEILRAGGLVAFPTETVYGLGADATTRRRRRRHLRGQGPAALQSADRPSAPTPRAPRHVGSTPAPESGRALLARPADPGAAAPAGVPVSLLCSAGLDSLGIRVPGHPSPSPCCGASAGPWPRRAPTAPAGEPDHARRMSPQSLGAGSPDPRRRALPVGLESTVLDLTGPPACCAARRVTAREIAEPIGPPAERPERPAGQLARPARQPLRPRACRCASTPTRRAGRGPAGLRPAPRRRRP